jgi:hypothetical protein
MTGLTQRDGLEDRVKNERSIHFGCRPGTGALDIKGSRR